MHSDLLKPQDGAATSITLGRLLYNVIIYKPICFIGIRVQSVSCVKQNIVVKYGTVSSDTLALNISEARNVMQQLVNIGKKELDSKCRSKATLRLGPVKISESSGYNIQATLEYLVDPRYSRWDFSTCAANANVLQEIVKDPSKAPDLQGQYSSYEATNVTKDTAGFNVASTCCDPGSLYTNGACRTFYFVC